MMIEAYGNYRPAAPHTTAFVEGRMSVSVTAPADWDHLVAELGPKPVVATLRAATGNGRALAAWKSLASQFATAQKRQQFARQRVEVAIKKVQGFGHGFVSGVEDMIAAERAAMSERDAAQLALKQEDEHVARLNGFIAETRKAAEAELIEEVAYALTARSLELGNQEREVAGKIKAAVEAIEGLFIDMAKIKDARAILNKRGEHGLGADWYRMREVVAFHLDGTEPEPPAPKVERRDGPEVSGAEASAAYNALPDNFTRNPWERPAAGGLVGQT